MSNIKVTQAEIDLLLNSADVQVRTEFGKCTVVTARLRNGFILTESSACVDPANYDAELGKKLCLQHIENRLWEMEGYALQKRTDEERTMECAAADTETQDFGWALNKLRCGWSVRRPHQPVWRCLCVLSVRKAAPGWGGWGGCGQAS